MNRILAKIIGGARGDSSLMGSVVALKGSLDNVGANIFIADRDLNLRYMNRRAEQSMRKIENELVSAFGIRVDTLIGQNIDRFHGNRTAEIRGRLSDDRHLPIEADIQLGPLLLKLIVNGIYDNAHRLVGFVVNWDEITEKRRLETEAARMNSMMENAPTNVLYADRDLVLQYMNPASKKKLQALQQYLPVSVDEMIGKPIDIYHKNPSYQRGILADPKNLPKRANIEVGPETLDLLVSPIYDNRGEYLGPMVTWEVITAKLKVAEQARKALQGKAKELSEISQQMAGNAEETSSQISLVSDSSEQVNKNVQVVASSAEEMSASIKEISKNASDALQVAQSAVTVTDSTNETIKRLGESSAEIGNIVKVVTSIAEQTNLLALNATIEAARAGEAGKGFAVVANEVKELAKETSTATEDIGKRIDGIQTDTKKAVEAIEQVTEIISRINEISSSIATAVEEQSITTAEIGRSVGDAAKSVEEISENISGVASAAKNTAQGASATLSSAEELGKIANELTVAD